MDEIDHPLSEDEKNHVESVLRRAREDTRQLDLKAVCGLTITVAPFVILTTGWNYSASGIAPIARMLLVLFVLFAVLAAIAYGYALIGRTLAPGNRTTARYAEEGDRLTYWGSFAFEGWSNVPERWHEEASRSLKFNGDLQQVRIVANINAAKLWGINTGLRLNMLAAFLGLGAWLAS